MPLKLSFIHIIKELMTFSISIQSKAIFIFINDITQISVGTVRDCGRQDILIWLFTKYHNSYFLKVKMRPRIYGIYRYILHLA
jgi:hypothetical protein